MIEFFPKPNIKISRRNPVNATDQTGMEITQETDDRLYMYNREAIGEPIRISYKSLKPHEPVTSPFYVPQNTYIGYSISDKMMMYMIITSHNYNH